MDLADIWQQHKRFILLVASALLLLLVGRGVIHSKWDYETVVVSSARTTGVMSKAEKVPDEVVRALQEEVTALRSRYAALATTMRHKPQEAFIVPAGESNPRSYFFRRHSETKSALIEAAERQDIRVPEALGLKDMAPTEPDEIRRQLVALDVVQQVVIESIGAGVRRITTIQIEDASKGRSKASSFLADLRVRFTIVGGEKSIRTLVIGLVDGAARGQAAFLAIDQARLKPVKGELGMLELDLTAAALQIDKSADEETP
ncbi:MAG: hypothetical protein EXS13_10525 [Planctomycetes bacterium]|nr:hypothetical protein [Planctomycetota bacterium]